MPSYSLPKSTFSNVKELETGLNWAMREAEYNTLKILREKLNEFITKDVYMKSNASGVSFDSRSDFFRTRNGEWKKRPWSEIGEYERTYDLYNVWKITKPYISHGKVYGSITVDTDAHLTVDVSKHQHVSPIGYKGRKTLNVPDYVHIINDGLDYSHSMFGTMLARPFWDNFNDWARENYSLIYKNELQKILGFNNIK